MFANCKALGDRRACEESQTQIKDSQLPEPCPAISQLHPLSPMAGAQKGWTQGLRVFIISTEIPNDPENLTDNFHPNFLDKLCFINLPFHIL